MLKNGADVVGLFCVGDTAGDANYGVWDGGLGSLVFTICSGETFEAGSEYQLEWLVRNPQEAQSSPGISITALGTATFVRDSVDKPEQDILGVANGVHPLLVITPSFVTKVLAQSNFLAGEENQITATLVSNVDVGSAGSAFISICCLDSATVSDSEVAVQVSSIDDLSVPRFCGGAGGAGDEGFGSWNSTRFEIMLHLCTGDENMLESFSEYVVRFTVTNPTWNQSSPAVGIRAQDYFRIEEASMEKPGLVYSGVQSGSDPLKVVVPHFAFGSIGQSTPIRWL